MTGRKILITGGAGFIGSHLSERCIAKGDSVVALDNFNNFYNPDVKRKNIENLLNQERYKIVEGDIRNVDDLAEAFNHGPFDIVVHLAAMAGVRPSIEQPSLYMDVNVLGTQKLIDCMVAQKKPPFLAMASSSSVYGERDGEPFKETDITDRPISPYAASKVACEMIAHAAFFAHQLSTVCLRFFTVYGPRQRPDLAIHKFCKLIDADEPIELYGDGTTMRDYTFIDDIVSGIESVMELAKGEPIFEILNLGRSEPVKLSKMVECIEHSLGKKAKIVYKPRQTGDVTNTFANIEKAQKLIGYKPVTSIEKGIDALVAWHQENKKSDSSNRIKAYSSKGSGSASKEALE
ncbi:MAG: SDR family NAD(P)-dependent oxidoreductase [Candidatus Melainabacteria bacterium]|nr:SDR family NAD(P)-dependent oxidoreductase [Candidatus Melainabacteria bacterium]